MNNRKMLTDCPELVKQWDFFKNGDLRPEQLSAGSGYKAWWLCEKDHSWQATVNHRHRGTGCPVCANRIVVKGVNDLSTVNPDLAAQWNYEKNEGLLPSDVPNGTHRKVWWICPHGHEWRAEILSRIAGNDCPYCAGQRAITGVNDLSTVSPLLAVQFDVGKNLAVSVKDVCYASNKKFWWLCELGHSWQASPNTRQKSGCPFCAGKTALPGFNDLLSLNPVLASEWDYVKNTLRPSEVTLHSGRHIWWLCKKRHSWKAVIAHRASGSGCPFCSGRNAVQGENDLRTVKPELVCEWDFEKNKDSIPDGFLPQSNAEVWWKCEKGHSWKAPIYRRYLGSGCPFCTGLSIIKGVNDLQSQHPVLAEQWDYNKNNKNTEEVHVYSNGYAWWLCEKGHSWKAIINNRTSKGRGCPYCSGYLAIPGETDLLTVYTDFVSEWDYDKNTIDIRTVTEHSHKQVWWKCSKGHSWKIAVKTRAKGNGCPYCAGKKAIPGKTDLLTVAPHQRNGKAISDVTIKSNYKAWWTCDKKHRWKTQVYNRTKGCGCPYCAGKVIYSAKNVR